MKRLAIVATVVLTGCASVENAVLGPLANMDGIADAAAGLTVERAIDQMGYPVADQVLAGRRILTWHRQANLSGGGLVDCTLKAAVVDGKLDGVEVSGANGACLKFPGA